MPNLRNVYVIIILVSVELTRMHHYSVLFRLDSVKLLLSLLLLNWILLKNQQAIFTIQY